MPIELARVREAQVVLARHFAPTRLVRATSLTKAQCDVHLKLESELPTGSFKVRGAVYALSAELARGAPREVVAASTGNHGAAVAYAARLLGIPATIFLPVAPNPVKLQRISDAGARIVEHGVDLSAAIDAAAEYAARESAFFLHDASDGHIPAGTGTIGLEVIAQLPAIDTLYVPMGDTALIRGVASAAKALKPAIRIVGVVAERAPAYYLSWNKRMPVSTATAETIADGLAVTRPLGANVVEICDLVDRVVTVSEEEMLSAIKVLTAHEHVTAEPAGAAATAAFLRDDPQTGTFALLVTGANIAPHVRRAAQTDRQTLRT